HRLLAHTRPHSVPTRRSSDLPGARWNNYSLTGESNRGRAMAPASTQEFTLHLPTDLIEMVRKAAQERLETRDKIVAEALQFSLQDRKRTRLNSSHVSISYAVF